MRNAKKQPSSGTQPEIDYEALREKSVPELLKEREEMWKEKRSAAGEWILAYEKVLKEKGYAMPEYDAETQLKAIKAKQPGYFPSQQKMPAEVRTSRTPSRPYRLLRAIPVTVIALCALFVIAGALGMDEWVVTFKDGVYTMFNASGQIETEISDVSEYRSLQDALDENGIADPIAPTWIPGRFTLKSVTAAGPNGEVMITAHYEAADETSLNIFVSQDAEVHGIEGAEDDSLEVYKFHSTEFQITTNYDNQAVFWNSDHCYCHISGDISSTEVKTIIRSIFKE